VRSYSDDEGGREGLELRLGLVFSFQQPPTGGVAHAAQYEASLRQVARADALGYRWLNVTEHHVSADGYLPASLPVLAAFAAVTHRIGLSTGMIILPLAHPVRLAEEAAVVDNLSGGRLALGVAAGYRDVEFEVFGVDRSTRGRRMDESLDVLRLAWTGEPFSFSGQTIELPEIVVAPKPVQHPHPPIWVGGVSTVALRRGLGFDSPLCPGGSESLTEVRDDITRYRLLRAEAGLTTPPRVVLPRLAVVADTTEEARRRARPALEATLGTWGEMGSQVDPREALSTWETADDWAIVGSAERCAERIAELRDLGVTDLMLHIAMPTLDTAFVDEAIEGFAALSRVEAGATEPDRAAAADADDSA
jgi:probable F420-dependent oxidoreductase